MKQIALIFCSLFALSSFADVREVVLKTEMIKNAEGKEVTHWSPEKIEVTQGETIKLVAQHDLPAGFDFHGLMIPALKITETVNRHKPVTKEVTIPKTLKPGEYDVKCQFHAAHVGAKLVVKEAPSNSAGKK